MDMIKKNRKSPLACRPDKDKEYLYKRVKSEKRKLKLDSQNAVIQHILVQYFKEPDNNNL